jgi:hypothetical protein
VRRGAGGRRDGNGLGKKEGYLNELNKSNE